MALPRKLKNLNLFNDGNSYLGQVNSVTLPTLTRSMEDYRGGGMSGPVKIDHGQEALELSATYGGLMREVLEQYGITSHDGVQLRFAGAYQRDDTGAVDAVEVVIRGRHSEIEFGDAQAGEDTEFSVTTACSYYKLSINGSTVIEIDLLNLVENVNGTDRLAQQRRAIGL
ncbi:phage major tail tube protein [Microbulbifer discodermiae]|uniref:phage major tail tube protein n=1 Tax=Microbulbifer sp. 2201CG32-9 TaxID=3232309 RepID=UPI00345C0E9B